MCQEVAIDSYCNTRILPSFSSIEQNVLNTTDRQAEFCKDGEKEWRAL